MNGYMWFLTLVLKNIPVENWVGIGTKKRLPVRTHFICMLTDTKGSIPINAGKQRRFPFKKKWYLPVLV